MKKHHAGFSLVEVIIASALALIAALGVAYFITGAKSTSVLVEGSSECQTRVQQVISKFSDHNNALQVDNWHPTGNASTPPENLFPNPEDHRERFLAAPFWKEPKDNPNNMNPWLLINGAANWALYIYNYNYEGDPFCSLPGATTRPYGREVSTNSQWRPAGSPLKDEKIFLNVQKQTSNGAISCDDRPNLEVAPGSGIGLRLTATLQYTDNSGVSKVCQASTLLLHGPDRVGANPSAQHIVPNCTGSGICIGGSVSIDSGNPIYCGATAARNATIGISASEPGVILMCKLDYANARSAPTVTKTSGWQPCTRFSVAGSSTSGVVTQATGWHHDSLPKNVTAVGVTFSGLEEGWYTISAQAVDSGRNVSPLGSISFGVDLNGPTGGPPPTPPSPFIQPFPPSTYADGHLDATGEWGYSAISGMFGGTQFQCQDQPPFTGAYWSGGGTEAIRVSSWRYEWCFQTGAGAPIPGRCWSNSSASPGGLTNGVYQAKYRVGDRCHGYVDSGPTSWTVDLSGFTTQITPPVGTIAFNKPAPVTFSFTSTKAGGGPVRYTCEAADGSGNASGSSGSCTPANFPASAKPCVGRTTNICTKGFDGCGRVSTSVIRLYEVRGDVGDNCREVACKSPLICSRDQSPNSLNGICSDPGSIVWPSYSPAGSAGECIENANCETNLGYWNCVGEEVACNSTSPSTGTWNNSACANTVAAVGTACSFTSGGTNYTGTCEVRNYGNCNITNDQGPIGPPPPANTTCPIMATACGGPGSPPTPTPAIPPVTPPPPTPVVSPSPICPDPATICPGEQTNPLCPEGEKDTGCANSKCEEPKHRDHQECVTHHSTECNGIWYNPVTGAECFEPINCANGTTKLWLDGSCNWTDPCLYNGGSYGQCWLKTLHYCWEPYNTCPSTSTYCSDETVTGACGETCPTGTKSTGCGGGGGGGGGGGCFLAGTLVDTPAGRQPIESIKVGQQVWSYDFSTGKQVSAVVTWVFVHNHHSVGELDTSRGVKLFVTPEHRFYLPEENRWVGTSALQPGMELLLVEQGRQIVDRVVGYNLFPSSKVQVYNLEVAKHHNYFVEGILVHNLKNPVP